MDLKALKDTPPWDWPAGTAEKLVNVLRDEQAIESDRLLATDMAGDFTVVNDELVEALLSILRNSEESKQVRARGAISLGPILEYAETEGLDDASDVPISRRTFQEIQELLHQLYGDAHIPKEVRRRILEASVRAPREWHENAVRSPYSSGDDLWKLTAVFCMHFVRGFDEQIVEELDSMNPDIHLEAALALEVHLVYPRLAVRSCLPAPLCPTGVAARRPSVCRLFVRVAPDRLHGVPGCADRQADSPTRFHTPATSRHVLPVLLAALRRCSCPEVNPRSHGESMP
jgi:hypothetical protein